MKLNRVTGFCVLMIAGLACLAAQAAAFTRADIPTGSAWYIHVNLDLIQNSEAGRRLMLETVDDALDDVEEELGVNVRQDIQGITLFGKRLPVNGEPEKEGAIILHGAIGAASRDALLSALERKGAQVSPLNSAGMTYYRVADGDHAMTIDSGDGHVKELSWGDRDAFYFSFGPSQAMITHSMDMMQEFLDAGGLLGGAEIVDNDALVVLQADRALLQGGANTVTEIGGEWDSSVLRNVDAVALVIAEDFGGLQISAQLTASTPEVAESVRNIVEGVVALKALDESDSELGAILRQVRFETDGLTLTMNVPVTAAQIDVLKDL